MSRRRFGSYLLMGLLSPSLIVGCEPIIILAWIVVLSTTSMAVCQAAESYWRATGARLDAQKKELEVQGFRDGRAFKGTVKNLTDEQIAAIQKNGEFEVHFKDGQKTKVQVSSK